VAVLLVFTQFVLPGSGGHRGTPGALMFFGGVSGLISALTAVGIILIYRTNRIINFAQSAIGAAGAVFFYNLVTALHWPFVLAFVVGIVVGAGVGLLIDLLFKRFFFAPRLLVTALTITVQFALIGFAITISSFPIFGQSGDRTLAQRLGAEQVKLPFRGFHFHIGSNKLAFGFPEVFAIGMCLLALAAVTYFLYRTRTGVAVRAAAENSERASLLGIPIRQMSTVVWTIAGALSALSLLLLGTITDFTSASGGATTTLIRALAAATLARMKSIPVAVATAIGIELATQAVRWTYPDRVELLDLGLLLLIVIGLLFQSRDRERGSEGEAGTWQTIEEFRPVPRELLGIRGVRVSRWVVGGVILAVVAILPWLLQVGPMLEAGRVLIYTLVILSLVVLTGWAGEVSLGQFGLVAIGAVVGGALTSRLNVPFWVALPAAALFTALFAVVLGLTSLRIRGFYLGVTTLAFAAAVESMLFSDKYFKWLLPTKIDRPTAFFFDFNDERSMYYLTAFLVLLAVFVVAVLRRTRVGRVFIGIRENESNASSFGVSAVRTRLTAFAFSGFIAGYAGVILAHQQRAIDPTSYTAALSLEFFVVAAIAGFGSVSGAIVGGVFIGIQTLAFQVKGPFALLLGLFFGGPGLLILLYAFPRGLSSIVYGLRDSVLRIIAQRRQIVVPSLFADYDPAAAERQLVPLSEPDERAGLGALPPDRRYTRASGLYALERNGDRGQRVEETRALRAAAQRVSEEA
jgi:branched-chain amino acid transport system permease protein